MADTNVRLAAETLLRVPNRPSSIISQNEPLTSINSHYYEDPIASTSHSLSSLMGEDVILGSKHHGRMSMVRRFFCLLILFDLLLVSLIWILWIMLIGSNHIMEVLQDQIIYYKIQTSFFDIIMAATSRFVILLLFYGLLAFNHWFIVALTTAGTCAFLIAKVFVYHWVTASQPTFEVCLVIISFILAWGEAWFLDFRVIPQELHAQQFLGLQSAIRQTDSLSAFLNESQLRNPVLRNFLRQFHRSDDNVTESVRNFYSPLESPEHSDDEEGAPVKLLDDFTLVRKGVEALEISWKILNSNEWILEKELENGDEVHSKKFHPYGKIFRLTANFNISSSALFEELYSGIERITEWNDTVLESKRIRPVDEHTDIIYQVSASGGNGLISSRDFVSLRHWEMKGSCFVIGSVSVTCPLAPTGKYVRGENGPGCWTIRPTGDDNNSSLFQWLLNTNLKGWIPQTVIDRSLTSVLIDYSVLLRAHINRMPMANT